MKKLLIFSLLVIASLVLAGCGQSQPTPTSLPTENPPPPVNTDIPPVPVPTDPIPTPTNGLSTTASTRTELSFAFPGEWDGSSRLTFGEGEFVKSPDQPLGVTFQIGLGGDPDTLLNSWGTKDIGIIGIVTFTPEEVTDGLDVIISRSVIPTKIAQGDDITARVAYIQRPDDVMEVMWFAPTDQWDTLQPVFQTVLENIELWRKYADGPSGLQTMYVYDWLAPQPTWQDSGLWFQSNDERTGVAIFLLNEIADPNQLLLAWSADRLAPLGFSDCSLSEGDRMSSMGGQWESISGECTDSDAEKVTYEISYIPNVNRMLEVITYAPSVSWDDANEIAFAHLLGMLTDLR